MTSKCRKWPKALYKGVVLWGVQWTLLIVALKKLLKSGLTHSKTKHFSDMWSIWCRFIIFYNSGKVKKVEIHFCKMSQMVAIAKLPSWYLAFFRFAWRSEKVEINFCKISRMVTIAKLPSWHFTFFRLWRSEKSRNSFLQNFANYDHCETAIMTPHFLSS